MRKGGYEAGTTLDTKRTLILRRIPVTFRHCISEGRLPGRLIFHDQAKELELILMTLEQACLPEYQEAQCAFKDSMIH